MKIFTHDDGSHSQSLQQGVPDEMHGWLAAGIRIEAQTKHGINAKVLQKSGLVGKMVETRWCGLTDKKFFRLRLTEDYQRWTIAAAILEAAERFTSQENEPALQEFQLVVGGMKALAENRYEPLLILDAFLLRSLAVAGYAPSMTICSRCEKPGPHRYFSLVGGGSVCADCRPSACATPAPETLELMGALLSSDWDSATASEGKHRREASGLIAAYLQWHLERGLRSLPMVERV